MAGEFLMGYGEPLNSHQASRALLRRTLDELSQVEKLPRSWEALQPVAASLEGHAATVLGVLRSNTAAVRVRLDQRRRRVDAWRDVLSEVAGSDSEDAQTWREALLTAASENFDADEAEARVEALLHGQAPLLRAVELGNRAAVCDQSAYLATYTAASAAGSRLSCLATHLAAAEPGVGDGEPSPLDDASVEWVGSLAGDVAEFGSVGFSQFHDLFAGEQASVSAAGSLARSTLDQARARGLLISQVLGALSRQGIAPELLAEMGPVAVSLAESGARLQLLVAYASHVLAHSHSLDADSWLASEREAAELEFASKVPTGTQARIDDVGGLAEGELVEVQGRVQSLVLEHDPKPPKFSSFVVLRAFDTDASVRLRAHMFSLERNGLVEGACCKIRGFVRRQRGWLGEDETGLDIDRVSLSKLRKLSWLDDVAYRMRPFFRLYQDEMSLFNTPGGV